MSRRAAWTCSKCQHQLGEVVGESLRVWAPAPMWSPDALAVECPRCRIVNVWRREVVTATRG